MLDRLEAAVDDQRRFVANASHELRSPLTVIRTEADVTLANPDATVAELREMGEVVLEATDRTEALLDGLLVLARSRRPLRRDEAVDLAVLLPARGGAGRARGRRRLGRAPRRGRRPAPVRGDAALLERLAANLAENAVRHNVRRRRRELEAGVGADGSAPAARREQRAGHPGGGARPPGPALRAARPRGADARQRARPLDRPRRGRGARRRAGPQPRAGRRAGRGGPLPAAGVGRAPPSKVPAAVARRGAAATSGAGHR